MLQTCRTCQTEKPLDAFEIRSDTKKPRGVCRACRNEQLRKKYAEDSTPWKESGKKYRDNNREQYRRKAREYAAANKERMNETSRQWAAANKETANARSIEWRKANRARVNEAAKERRTAAPEKQRTIVRNRRAKLKVSGEHTPPGRQRRQ